MVMFLTVAKEFIKKVYLCVQRLRFQWRRGLSLGKGVAIYGTPVILLRNGGKAVIGDHVTLNSWNKSYHLNMFAPVKIIADRPSATISIGERTRIHGTCLHARSGISVGKRCLIAANCQIVDANGHDLSFADPQNRINTHGQAEEIIIEDDVWIGAGTTVLPGVRIGRGSIIGAGSVVTKSIPSMVVAAGNPARIMGSHETV